MHLEKNLIIKKIEEWCTHKDISLNYKEKDLLISQVYSLLDKDKILSFDDFSKYLEYNDSLEQYENIDFDDEIISIKKNDIIDMIDFNVSGNNLFYANSILTHNSATNNIGGADNANVSDSMGTVMTADFMLFLLQNEEMKERKVIVCKVTKNRFNGRTDTWQMGIDYEHMRFHDLLVQGNMDKSNIDIDNVLGLNNDNLNNNFGIITAEKQKNAEKFAQKEVESIIKKDKEKLMSNDKNPFNSDIENLFSELGI